MDKEWAAVQGDRVLLIRETEDAARRDAEDLPTDVYDIVALPKGGTPGPIL